MDAGKADSRSGGWGDGGKITFGGSVCGKLANLTDWKKGGGDVAEFRLRATDANVGDRDEGGRM